MTEALRWCREEGMTTKGHPLVWACRSGVQGWLRGLPVEQTEELSRVRVTNTVRGLTGEIDLWDVVNEPVNVRTWRHKIEAFDDPPDWGIEEEIPAIADYVEQGVPAGPTPRTRRRTLILNEFITIASPRVRDRFCALVRELRLAAHPSPVWGSRPTSRGRSGTRRPRCGRPSTAPRAGLPLHATELTPQSTGKPITGGWRTARGTSRRRRRSPSSWSGAGLRSPGRRLDQLVGAVRPAELAPRRGTPHRGGRTEARLRTAAAPDPGGVDDPPRRADGCRGNPLLPRALRGLRPARHPPGRPGAYASDRVRSREQNRWSFTLGREP